MRQLSAALLLHLAELAAVVAVQPALGTLKGRVVDGSGRALTSVTVTATARDSQRTYSTTTGHRAPGNCVLPPDHASGYPPMDV